MRVKGKFRTRATELAKVVPRVVSQGVETVVNNGATAANVLGLTPQVPVHQGFQVEDGLLLGDAEAFDELVRICQARAD